MSNRYSYQPLHAPREIRLLQVLLGKQSDDISCKIDSENLDNPPEYEALSYTWGADPSEKSIIRLCDDKILTVTENLYSALHALRYGDRPRKLWVDAVCINQKDDEEKNKQVGMMRDIFRGAERVVGWVGEEDPEDVAALKVKEYLKKTAPIDFPSCEEVLTWCALPKFIKRRWFSRAWVVQEVALAKRLTLYCGQNQMEWDVLRDGLFMFLDRMGLHLNTSEADSLERVFTLLSIRNLVTEHTGEHQEQWGCFHPFPLSRIDDDRDTKKVEAGDLLHFVRGTRLFESKHARDHIFALLGLFPKEEWEGIKISYSKSYPVSDVYGEFTRVMIVKHGNLDVLSQAGLNSKDGNLLISLPSWVPDWTRPMKSYPLRTGAYAASGTPEKGGSSRLKSMRPEEFQRVLTLRGKVVDTIESLVPGFSVSDRAASELLEGIDPRKFKFELLFETFRNGLNPLKLVHAISYFLQSKTVRIKPELEKQWYQAAQHCKEAYSNRSEDFESAYMQTLIGNLPFKHLESCHEDLVRDCFEIWREWLSEVPRSHGIFSKGYLTGKTKTGKPLIKLNSDLIKLFSQHGQHSWLSKKRLRERKRGCEQVNSSTRFPIFLYEWLWPARWRTGIRSDDLMHDDESVKLYYARMFSGAVERMAFHRQFCWTREGFMGWVPLAAEKDDVVCLLEGGQVPYILRPEDSGEQPSAPDSIPTKEYRLVGEAYIHGLMDGKKWVGEMDSDISLI